MAEQSYIDRTDNCIMEVIKALKLNKMLRASLALAACSVLWTATQSHADVGDTFTDSNFKYTVLSETGSTGTVSVDGQSSEIPSGAVTIPESVTMKELHIASPR